MVKTILLLTCIAVSLQGLLLYLDVGEPESLLITPYVVSFLVLIIFAILKRKTPERKFFGILSIVGFSITILWSFAVMFFMALGAAFKN